VARNRAGRSGTKGRGRGSGKERGIISTATTTNNISRQAVTNGVQTTKKLGSNAWRYERKEDDLDTDLGRCAQDLSMYDEDIIEGRDAYEGPSHDTVRLDSIDFDFRSLSGIGNGNGNGNDNFTTRIDNRLLSISLKTLPMAEWMRMPQRHVDFIDRREVREKDGKNGTHMTDTSFIKRGGNDINADHEACEKSNHTIGDIGLEDYESVTQGGKDETTTKTPNVLMCKECVSANEKSIQAVDTEVMKIQKKTWTRG